jgi:hypothetical protein
VLTALQTPGLALEWPTNAGRLATIQRQTKPPTRKTSTKPSDNPSAARHFSACQPAVLKSLFQPRMTRINTDSENEFQPSALISDRARHFRRRPAMAGQAVRAAPASDFTAA